MALILFNIFIWSLNLLQQTPHSFKSFSCHAILIQPQKLCNFSTQKMGCVPTTTCQRWRSTMASSTSIFTSFFIPLLSLCHLFMCHFLQKTLAAFLHKVASDKPTSLWIPRLTPNQVCGFCHSIYYLIIYIINNNIFIWLGFLKLGLHLTWLGIVDHTQTTS